MGARHTAALLTLCVGCATNEPYTPDGDGLGGDALAGGDEAVGDPGPGDPGPGDPGPGDPGPLTLTVVTFNTGTSTTLLHDLNPFDGYTSTQAQLADEWYGNGLAWRTAIAGTIDWFAALQPDLVVFQEIFHPEECASIPSQHHTGFICETWSPGDPTVAQMVLGNGYQVACHLGKSDKCAAVKKSFGSFAGCAQDLCIEGLDGFETSCGSGSRNGRGLVQLTRGGELTLVNHHGSSGINGDDQDCRVLQIDQIFVDFGDGQPAANGARNIVMGDLNTDPARWTLLDPSAARWNDFVGGGFDFGWITDATNDATPTYLDVVGIGVNIDHVASDAFTGSCVHPGVDGEDPVLDFILFDHKPAVCVITEK